MVEFLEKLSMSSISNRLLLIPESAWLKETTANPALLKCLHRYGKNPQSLNPRKPWPTMMGLSFCFPAGNRIVQETFKLSGWVREKSVSIKLIQSHSRI